MVVEAQWTLTYILDEKRRAEERRNLSSVEMAMPAVSISSSLSSCVRVYAVPISRPSRRSRTAAIGKVIGISSSMSGRTMHTEAAPMRRPWREQTDCGIAMHEADGAERRWHQPLGHLE